MNLEVVTAAKAPQLLADAPASITVVTAADIKTHGYRTLLDALQSIRGIGSSYDRYTNYLGVRGYTASGQYNSKTLLLIDGYRTNENIYSGAFLGIDAIIDIDLVERIEFLPGPGSAIYGDSAFFGVINVITKKASSMTGLTVAAEAANRRTEKGRVTFSAPASGDGISTILSVSNLHSRGSDINIVDSGGNVRRAGGLDGARDMQFFGKISTDNFSLTAVHGSRTKVEGTSSFGAVSGMGTTSVDAVSYISGEWRNKLDDSTDAMIRTSVGRYAYDSNGTFDDGLGGSVVNVDQQEGRWVDFELQLTRTLLAHRIVAGVDVRLDIKQQQKNFDRSPAFTFLDVNHRRKHSGFYVQDEWQIRPDLAISSGLRYDRYDSFGAVTDPRVGIVYSPTASDRIKLLYGQAFRAPSANETDFVSEAIGIVKNPDLKAERIVTTELVWESYIGAKTRLVALLFNNRVKDLIESVEIDSGDIRYENIGVVKVFGGQLELERTFGNGLRLRASGSWHNAKTKSPDGQIERPVDSPRQIYKLNASAPLANSNVLLGFEAQYTGERLTRDDKVGGYTVANLALSTIKPLWGFDVTLTAYNLFNHRFFDPSIAGFVQDRIEQDAREWRLKLVHRF